MTSTLVLAALAMQLSAMASLGSERSPSSGEVCTPLIEIHADARIASLRAHSSALESCSVDEVTYRRLISDWLSAYEDGGAMPGTLFLGRAVNYPWLSRLIADTALADPAAATQSPQSENPWLAGLLSSPPLLDRLQAPFHEGDRTIRRVSVEKVLWGPASEHSSDPSAGDTRVPFDAQIWIEFDGDLGAALGPGTTTGCNPRKVQPVG